MKPRRRRQLPDYREGRAKVSHQIDSFVERVQPVDGQVGAIFLCARGILGLELLGEEDLFKGACQDHQTSPSVLNDEDLGSVPEDGGLVVGGHAGPLFERPSPGGRGYDLRIDTGEVIAQDFTGTTPWPCRALGAGPGPLPSEPGPSVRGRQRSRNLRR